MKLRARAREIVSEARAAADVDAIALVGRALDQSEIREAERRHVAGVIMRRAIALVREAYATGLEVVPTSVLAPRASL